MGLLKRLDLLACSRCLIAEGAALHCQFTLQDANRAAAVGGVKWLPPYVTYDYGTAYCVACSTLHGIAR